MNETLFRERCRENQIKITDQRLAIYKELSRSFNHPSADRIFQNIKKKFPNISFDTVNRTVLTFSEIGLVRMVEGCGDARRFDPNTHQHHHLRCVKCHSIIDFQNKTYDELQIPKKLPSHFKILSKKMILEGLCEDCSDPKKGDRYARRKQKK
ncbi:MAG: transcriptional repressor [Candidatus Omnitrophota bacterium]